MPPRTSRRTVAQIGSEISNKLGTLQVGGVAQTIDLTLDPSQLTLTTGDLTLASEVTTSLNRSMQGLAASVDLLNETMKVIKGSVTTPPTVKLTVTVGEQELKISSECETLEPDQALCLTYLAQMSAYCPEGSGKEAELKALGDRLTAACASVANNSALEAIAKNVADWVSSVLTKLIQGAQATWYELRDQGIQLLADWLGTDVYQPI